MRISSGSLAETAPATGPRGAAFTAAASTLTAGKVAVNAAASESDDDLRGIALQADGKLIVVGGSLVAGGSWFDYSVARLDADGTLDTSFSHDGKARFDVRGDVERAISVVVQPDGRIVVGGESTETRLPCSRNDFTLLRLHADGTLDASFGSGSDSTLGSAVEYTEEAAPVVLDADAAVFDARLAALGPGDGNYAGARVELERVGGANAQDRFSALRNLSFGDSLAVLSGTVVGVVDGGTGRLAIVFHDNATQLRVDEVLRSIGYANGADAPEPCIELQWTFRGGDGPEALSVTAYTAVQLHNVNDAPTGGFGFSGAVGSQWLRDGEAIAGATAATYTLTQADVGHVVALRMSFTDTFGRVETRTSAATAPVANVNDAPTGAVAIGGVAELVRTLTASHTLADLDGVGAVSWQWLRVGYAIAGATGEIYTLVAADLGKAISVKAPYVDGFNFAESRTSAATASVGTPAFTVAGWVELADGLHSGSAGTVPSLALLGVAPPALSHAAFMH